MISVVVPVYNRRENMAMCLSALAHQEAPPTFEVIIVDDGSTDGLREWLGDQYGILTDRRWPHEGEYGFWIGKQAIQIRYLNGGPNKGFRGGRARNIGAFNCDRGADRLYFVDSDVILTDTALQALDVAHKAQPQAIIAGPYYFLPPHNWQVSELASLRHANSWDELREKVDLKLDETLTVQYGNDLGGRTAFANEPYAVGKGGGLGALSGNISYPVTLFWQLGGFDEKITGHGGEDADLGLTADEHNADWLFYRPMFGWHLWHTRDQKKNAKEVQVNIEYIDLKHGVGRYANAPKLANDAKDWTWPGHYHKHHGTQLVKIGFDNTVWAVREGHRLGLTRFEWVARLGFEVVDINLVTQQQLDAIPIAGATPMELE